MLNSKKIISAIFLLISFILISCGDNKPQAGEKQVLTFWHFWSEPNQQKIIKELITEFEKDNNCKVETTELSWGDGKIKLFAAFNSNTAPDVMDLGSDWIAQFSSAGILADLSASPFNFKRFDTFFIQPSLWNGKYYAVPWVVNSRVLFYNKELFKKVGLPEDGPKTLQDIYTFAEKINSIQGVYGIGVNGSDPHRLYKKIVPFMWIYNGGIFDNENHLKLNTAQNAQAFEYYLSLSRVGIIETQKKLDDMFARGELGMWLSGSWLLEKIKNVNPLLNYSVMVIPGLEAGKPGISFAGGEYLSINKNAKNRELAEKFISFLTKGENALRFCKEVPEAGFPADINFYNDKYYNTLPFMPIFADQLKYARMTPVHPKWLDIESALENSIVEVLYGKKSSWESLNELQTSLEAIVNY